MNLEVLISSAIERFADRIAVVDGARRLTFRQLGLRTACLGSALAQHGLVCGSRIASLQFNSQEALEVDVMSARFGFCRTLLNARSGADDHVYTLNHCNAEVLFFGEDFAEHVASLRDDLKWVTTYVCVGEAPSWALSYDEFIKTNQSWQLDWEVTESDMHSIYYTSGSTGQPKGVMLSQNNWLVHVRNHLVDPYRHTSETDVLLHAAPLSHASGCLVIPHLVRGAAQCVLRKFDTSSVFDAIEEHGVTTMFLAPTMIQLMLDADGSKERNTSSLHTVIYGGAPMAAERVEEALNRWGPVLMQGYGQWETPQQTTLLTREDHVYALSSPATRHLLRSCGRPLSFVDIAIMDDNGNLLPTGGEGEIVVAGDVLMVGYLDDQAATDAIREGKWQRTGDIGRIDEYGYVYLTDRKKDVIITGGNNVYPREIEEILYQYPDIGEAIAIGIPDDDWGETVHVVASSRKGHALNEQAFLDWCKQRFATDKRPRSVTVVDGLARNSYGKILRREIRDSYWTGRDRRI